MENHGFYNNGFYQTVNMFELINLILYKININICVLVFIKYYKIYKHVIQLTSKFSKCDILTSVAITKCIK